MLSKKFVLISASLPPEASGVGIALFNLLKDIDPTSYYLINTKKIDGVITQKSYNDKNSLNLKANYYYSPPRDLYYYTFFFFGQFFKIMPLINLYIEKRVEAICAIIKNEQCDAIVACTSDLFSPIIAYYAAKKMNISFYFYLFDWYSRQWYVRKWIYPHQKWFGIFYEKILIENASGVIVPNESLSNEIFKNYGIKSEIIRNSIDLSMYKETSVNYSVENENEINIVYTGAIYDINFEAFLNLSNAIKQIKKYNLKLHLYVPQGIPKELKQSLNAPFIEYHNAVSYETTPEIQKMAHLLFLPFSFTSERQEIVKTSAPGKTGDYLASGTPIIVHAPSDSFVSWYFKKYKCGLVIDENNSKSLANGIESLLNNPIMQHEFSENAIKQSMEDFDSNVAKEKFLNFLLCRKGHEPITFTPEP